MSQEALKDYPTDENPYLRVCPDLVNHIRTVLKGGLKEVHAKEFRLTYTEEEGVKTEEIRWFVGPWTQLAYGTGDWGADWDLFAKGLFRTEYTDRGEGVVEPFPLRSQEFSRTELTDQGILAPQIKLRQYAGSKRLVTEGGGVTLYESIPWYRGLNIVVFPDYRMVEGVDFFGNGSDTVREQEGEKLSRGIIPNKLIKRYLESKDS